MAGEGGWGAHLLASCPRVPRRAGEASEEQGQNQRQRSPESPSPAQSSHGLKPSVTAQKPGSLSPVPPLPQAGPSPCAFWQARNSSGQPPHPPGALRLAFTTKVPPSPSTNVTMTDLLGLLSPGTGQQPASSFDSGAALLTHRSPAWVSYHRSRM